mmetsp:Transcript_36916/g.95601  ORF Transcript_36916/g.95601 Transcript_36916/m.95601 type:complete len:86 (-) Transcript_36916:40-297(-)
MRDESCKKASVGYCVLRPVQARLRLPPATCHLLPSSPHTKQHEGTSTRRYASLLQPGFNQKGRAAEPDAGKRQEASVQEESQKVE